MKKKLLALLLAALMIVSILPVTAFSEGEVVQENQVGEVVNEIVVQQDPVIAAANALMASGDLGDPAPTTPDDVHDALDTAIGSEMNAAGEYPPLSPSQIEEVVAAGADAAADQRLDNAEGVTGFSDGFTDFLADRAEEHADNAEQDAQDATNAADAAEAAADGADAALQDAENAKTKAEAQAAADAAQEASVAAQKAAADALAAAQDAAQEAERAQNDYLIAQAAYDAAKAEVEQQLAQGLIDAQTAEALTADVAAKADAAYNTMVAAQAAAEQAVTEAKAAADAADAELQAKIDALEEAIAANAANVAEKTGVALLTGAALAAAKLAAEATKLQVSYYEGQIESKQAEIDELEQKIADAQTAIDEAQAEVDRLKGELDDAADDYEQKAKELEEAETALAAAQNVVDNLTAIVEERQNATTAGVADAIAAVKDGSATTDQKKAIAEYVLGNASKYDSSAADVTIKEWITDEVFAVENGDGSVSYYKVVTEEVMGKDEQENDVVTDRYLQFVQVEPKDEEELDEMPDEGETWEAGTQISSGVLGKTRSTDLIARKGSDEYPVVLYKTNAGSIYSYQVQVGSKTYALQKDGSGFYYKTGITSSKQYVTLIQPYDETVYAEVENGLSGSSKTVSDQWDAADNAEQNLSDAQTAQEAAAQAAQDALDTKNTAQNAYDAARETLNNFKAGQEADKQQLAVLKSEMKELDKKLNGNIAEQLARVFFDEGLSGVADVLANAEVPVEALSEEDQARYAELEEQLADLQEQYDNAANALARASIALQMVPVRAELLGLATKAGAAVTQDAVEQGQALYELYSTLADGEYNLDDVSAVVELLTGTGLSAKTKEFIMSKIVEVLAGIHENAVEALREAVEKGIEEVAAATLDSAEAALDAASAHAALEIAKAAKTLADALVEDAAEKKAAAEQAAADAKLAAELYAALLETYGPTDENVQRAREAAEAADSYAAIAEAEAKRAQAAADRARADYEKAQEIADNFPIPLGELIARYAWSLKGDGYAKLVNDPAKLNSKDFVKHVYSHFGIFLNYDGSVSEIGGYQVNVANRAPGDLIAKTDDGRFGVNFGLDGIDGVVEFDEATGEVVMTPVAELGDYAAVRVV